ncbi:SMI1/KNR4 family protein [Amycolatopsis sp. lyj-112]|uniref:SMI1/KNR4 family protein n=1 Tax=Amycolatopsis sp. lyj-112 TaxID=2789288 RepID=UPI00397C123C
MTVSVEQTWQRIVALLSEHAPVTAREIRPPAPIEHVERLQDAVGLALPADLRAWWAAMDGIDDQRDHGTGSRVGGLVPNSFVPLTVKRAEEEYVRQSGYPDTGCCTPEGTHHKRAGDTGFPFCTALVPICRDVSGGLLCVDLRPGDDHGRVMNWYASEGCYPSGWAGVAEILDEIAERLGDYADGGEVPYGERHPVITEGALTQWS